jgi:AcrR family transcriptional regulator
MSPRRAKVVTGGGDPAVQLREHLVASAAALVAERGTTAVTTREIARAAGVSDGVLYNYFADKNELIVAALVRRFEIIGARSWSGLPQPGSGSLEGNLVEYAGALHALVRDTLPMLAGLVAEHALLHRLIGEIHRPGQGILPFLNRIGEYLVEEQRLGRIRDGVDLEATMLLLTGASATLTMRAHVMPDDTDDHAPELLGRVVSVLLAGIA